VKHRLRTLAVAVVAIAGLGACTSNPSGREVAEDMIDALPNLTDVERTCLRDQLKGLDDATLKAVAAAGETGNFGPEFSLDSTGPEFQTFVNDLRAACID